MAEPFVNDPDFTLHVGDALETLQAMPAESVHCCVTSPPYWGLRDYGTGTWDGGDAECRHTVDLGDGGSGEPAEGYASPFRAGTQYTHQRVTGNVCKCGATRVDQQLGLEPTPDEYVTNMVNVFREVRRVLRADGTLWLNIGDSYASNWGMGAKRDSSWWSTRSGELEGKGWGDVETAIPPNSFKPGRADGLKVKDLCGIPWRLAFALQADGWYLRSDIIWSKPNPMPESVTDRPTKAHEYLFLLTKSPRYFYDADAIREAWSGLDRSDEPVNGSIGVLGQQHSGRRGPDGRRVTTVVGKDGSAQHRNGERWPNPGGRNKRSVWEIATEAYPDAHFATFPQALVEPCVKAGTSEHGCCPVCGAQWERETTEGYVQHRKGGDWQERQQDDRGSARSPAFSAKGTGHKTVETTGWRPTCDHYQDLTDRRLPPSARDPAGWPTVPGTVLDPFLGSGTTAQVARRLGRRSIGIELNPEYAQLAARRLQQLSLFAVETAEA